MNKLIHILFTFYFTLISTGVLYSKHYCGERVSRSVFGIEINSGNNCYCNHDSIDHNTSCCKSETTVLKAETQEFGIVNQFKIWEPIELDLLYTHSLELNFVVLRKLNNVAALVHPPPNPRTPLYLLNKNLLI